MLTKYYCRSIREDKNGEQTIAGKLAEMNDEPNSFKVIADYIEKNL